MRKPLVTGNWKMYTDLNEAVRLVKIMLGNLNNIDDVEKVICPPFISLCAIKEITKDTSIKLGAQNLYFEDKGAYTGEISAIMLIDLCDFVIIGHSERRQYFAENDEIVNKKIKAAFRAGLKPILCVGETLKDNEASRTEEIIAKQVRRGLADIAPSDSLVVAYEPIWAIGTGRAATGGQANSTANLIRSLLIDLWGNKFAKEIRILYGGSVTSTNVIEFSSQPEIDGALVGGASLKADEFFDIVSKTANIKTAK